MFKTFILYLPFGLGALFGYYHVPFWLVFIVSVGPVALVLSFFDPMAKSDLVMISAYYGSSAISTIVGYFGGKLLRDRATKKDQD
ncbi:hypothetical protein [Loktanella sp. R86503]|uniref:hypothetical protein n=1 Tax=Loktanella sp. R86503 TaxID=3093847 RepID=UPI0036DE04BE